jgi:hypothetical protein
MTVVEYMRDVALHTLLGPYGIPFIGVDVAKDTYEGDYSGVARGVAVEAGALSMSYGMLRLLNHLQGPKYAMKYTDLHKAMNPLRNLGVVAAVTSPAVIMAATGVGMFAATAAYPQVAGSMYQSAATGQPGIGSAGHDLIYGKMTWDNFW